MVLVVICGVMVWLSLCFRVILGNSFRLLIANHQILIDLLRILIIVKHLASSSSNQDTIDKELFS